MARHRTQNSDLESIPWWVIFAPMIAAVAAIVFFGISVESAQAAAVLVLIGLAALMVGGLLGFIFGIPRSVEEPTPANAERRAIPSNNLELVSDWLTKILVGIGLVQFAEFVTQLSQAGAYVKAEVVPNVSGVGVVTQIVIVFFLVTGFIAGFLWTRIKYGPIQVESDKLLNQLRKLERKIEDNKSTIASMASDGMARPRDVQTGNVTAASTVPAAQLPQILQSWPAPVREIVGRFQNAPIDYNSDPGRDLFPNAPKSANGKRLSAKIVMMAAGGVIFSVRMKTDRGSSLNGEVVFLLHPTYDEPVKIVRAHRSRAELVVFADGWYTLVAIADQGETVLALDLRDVPNVPEDFKRG